MASLKERIRELEREEIINALRECDWVMARAARRLGITERMIGYKVRKYAIRQKEAEAAELPGQSEEGKPVRHEIIK